MQIGINEPMYWNPMAPELAVTNFARSLHFYTDICGFTPVFQRTNPAFAFLQIGRAQLMIEQIEVDAWATAELVFPFGRGVNFQIEVHDVPAILNRVQNAGLSLFRPLTEVWYEVGTTSDGSRFQVGQREFLVQDPDGYLLRFTQPIGERKTPPQP